REDASENDATRISWTGDVWRLLPILQKYQPDLRVQQFDCGPTGLIACTRLAPYSRVLLDSFDAIVREFSAVSLSAYGLARLWELFPMFDTRQLAAAPTDIPTLLFGELD